MLKQAELLNVKRTARAGIAALVAVVLLAAFGASTAEATYVRIFHSTLEVTDDIGFDNTLRFVRNSGSVVITETRSAEATFNVGDDCRVTHASFPYEVTCDGIIPAVYDVALGSGDDTMYFDDTLDYTLSDPEMRVTGGSGRDSVETGDSDDVVNLGAGSDLASTNEGNDTVDLGSGDDMAEVGDGANNVRSGDGNDILLGGRDDEAFDAGAGNDRIYSASGNDSISGGDGGDMIEPAAGNDVVRGDGGSDWIDGGPGTDDVNGGAGSDILRGGADVDSVIGGSGDDSFDLQDGGADTFSCAGGRATSVVRDDRLDTNTNGDCVEVPVGGAGVPNPTPTPTPTPPPTPKPPCEATPSGVASLLGSLKVKGVVGTLGVQLSATKLRAGDKAEVRLVLSKNKKLNKKQAKALKKLAKRIELRNAKGKVVATLSGSKWAGKLAASELRPATANLLTVQAVAKKRGKSLLGGKPTVTITTLKAC